MPQSQTKSWSLKKKKEVVRKGDTLLKDPRPDDIIIAVVGPTGVGKSTFINAILGPVSNKAPVGNQLKSCTEKLQHFIIKRGDPGYHPSLRGRRLVIVDTPGFDDTHKEDSEILRRISAWLAHSYDNNAKVSGVIYLHDISLNRMSLTILRNLEIFKKLVGDDNLGSVILGTTKWGLLKSEELGRNREAQLKDAYWREFIAKGSTVFVADSESRNREMVDRIVNNANKKYVLMIQKELVELNKSIPQTDAGNQLRRILEQELKDLKPWNDPDSMVKLFTVQEQLKALKIPLGSKIASFLGLS